MRFSTIRTGIVATAAAVALAACGGHGLVPSQNVGGAGYAAPSLLTDKAAKTPCQSVPGFWAFGGSCVANELTSKGATIKLAKYQNITFTIAIGANNAKGKVPFIVGDAVGNGDITGTYKGKKFPPYGGKHCVSGTGAPQTCPGKSFVYVEAINGGKATVTLSQTPAITIVDTKGFPGKNLCFPAPLTTKGWSTQAEAIGKAPKGTKLVITPFPTQFPLPPGGVVLAMVCQ